MPAILGTGVMPAPGATGTQLTETTRRAFVPVLVDQFSKSTPLVSMLVANNQTAEGGASSVTIPAQFGDMVTTQSSDYSGLFNLPSDIPQIQDASFNMKVTITPIPMFGIESAIQSDYAVINLMDARMNSAGNNLAKFTSAALYGNVSDNSQIIGLPGAIDNGTNLVNYGGISRTAQPTWNAYYKTVAANTNPTRAAVLQYIVGTAKSAGGEMPHCVFCGMGTWLSLATDFVGQESYVLTPGSSYSGDEAPHSGFRAVMVAGVPVFCDLGCPEGTLYIINHNYLNLYIHSKLAFALVPFESMFANGQLGYIGGIVNLMELVCAKPSSCGQITNFNYTAI